MLIYLLLIFTLIYCFFISRLIIDKNKVVNVSEVFICKSNITLLFWLITLLILAVIKGVSVGTDYPMYYYFFERNIFDQHNIEPGISFFYELSLVFGNFLVFPLCVYTIFLLLIFSGLKKNTPNYLISIFMFVITHNYFVGYNQLRQVLALSFIFCFINYLLSNRKADKIKFAFVVLVASLFHRSALFLFVLFLIPKKRFNRKIVIPMFLLTIIIYFMPEFKNIIGEMIVKISGVYGDKYENNLSNFFGANKDKGLLQLMPVIIQMTIVSISLFLQKSKDHLKVYSDLYNFSTNMVIINLCLYSLSGIEAVDRLQVYFASFNIYYYSILIHQLLNMDKKREGQIFVVFIVLFWIAYYILRLFNNVHGIVPYSFFTS